MNIVRWEPFRELEDLWSRFDRSMPSLAWRRSGNGHPEFAHSPWLPAVDITENDAEYLIKAELPEVDKDDVNIEIVDGYLRMSGERKRETEQKDEKVHRVENYYGKFTRSFALPENVLEDKIQADCKDGVLRIHLKKRKESKPSKAKKIPIS